MKRWMLTCFAVLSLLVIIAGAIASPATAAPGSNATNAKQCQKGNWASLARDGQVWDAFANQDECVNYGAKGGKIVAYVAPIVSVVMARGGDYCVPQITATGFAPNATLDAAAWGSDRFGGNFTIGQQLTIQTNDLGGWTGSSVSGRASTGYGFVFKFAIDDVFSNGVTYDC